MSGSLRLNGSTSGFSEITAPDVAGDQTFTLPAVGGTLSTSNLVYQQGLWIPTVQSPFAIDFNVDRCIWSRVGNTVSLCGYISKVIANTTGAAGLNLAGLPYPVTQNGNYGSIMSQKMGIACNAAYMSKSAQVIQPYISAVGGWESVSLTDVNAAGNIGQIYLSVTYFTDDTTFVPQNGATIS